MNWRRKDDPQTKTKDLKGGNVFEHASFFYMRTNGKYRDIPKGNIPAVALLSGDETHFMPDTRVRLVEGTFVEGE